MQAHSAQGVSARQLTGRLEGIGVPDLFWSLCTARATGVLRLTSNGVTKRVFFSDGRIVFAASSDPNDRLGEMLLLGGKIRLDQFERAVARLPEGKRLGTILVEAGHLAPEGLIRAVLDQVRHIVSSLFSWEDGEYVLEEGPLPTDELVTLHVNTGSILLEGIRSIRSFTRIRRSVGSPRTRFQAVGGWREAAAGLDLSDGERQLLECLDGPGEAVDRLCREVFLSNFEIYQALWAFKVLGLVREREPAVDASAAGLATEGYFDRDGLPGLLVRLARGVETGVLHVERGGSERTFHVREGKIVFATSNSIDDGLVTYLLRRGMISLRDREETSKRLLSRKRVGQILLEMDVIDEGELSKLVRDHQSEILFDTFRWDEAFWIWTSGELPTIEDITLDRSIEDIVLGGLRRVTTWARVRDGCGGLSTRLELTPRYLEILDRMSIAGDDWDLITMLRAPKTPLELCRTLPLGDFRVCQTLWALRLLGAVDEAPLENALEAALGGAGAVSDEPPIEAELTPSRPPPPPEPIAPAVVADSENFEVTTIVEMTPGAPQSDHSIPASSWSEPAEERSTPWAWQPHDDEPAVEISSVDEGGEVISEPWRLAGDEARAPEPPPEVQPEAHVPDASVEESSFAIVPEPERSAEFEMGSPGSGVAALFEISPPEVGGRHDFEMDLQGAPREPSRADERADEPADEESPVTLDGGSTSPQPAPPEIVASPEPPFGQDEDPASASFEEHLPKPVPREDSPDRTVRIPREEIEAILRAERESEIDAPVPPAGPQETEDELGSRGWDDETAAGREPVEDVAPAQAPPEPPWDAPTDLEAVIASFVARHKAVFRVIRSEVGAGAANFVRSCRSSLDNGVGALLGAAEMQPDGAWDPAELRRLVCENRVSDAPAGFGRLIEHEVATLRAQIGERRTQALLDQIRNL